MFDSEMFGRLLAGLIVIGLAIGVWLLWPEGGTPATTTSTDVAIESSTTTLPGSSSTGTNDSTTTTSSDLEVIDTTEEAEQLLRQLWFGWFEGIYNEDEERIKEVVASQSQLDAAVGQFGDMEFNEAPAMDSIAASDIAILRADLRCTAVSGTVAIADFAEADFSGVHVFQLHENAWMLVSIWGSSSDRWEADCDAQLD